MICGKYSGCYCICGGFDIDYIYGKRIVGMLYSYSFCFCKLKFVFLNFDDGYEFGGEEIVIYIDLFYFLGIFVFLELIELELE